MPRKWVVGEPPEFPRDANGLSPFRQRWHSFMGALHDATRRLFVQTQDVDARVTVLEAAGGGAFNFEIDAGDSTSTYATGDLLVIDSGDSLT